MTITLQVRTPRLRDEGLSWESDPEGFASKTSLSTIQALGPVRGLSDHRALDQQTPGSFPGLARIPQVWESLPQGLRASDMETTGTLWPHGLHGQVWWPHWQADPFHGVETGPHQSELCEHPCIPECGFVIQLLRGSGLWNGRTQILYEVPASRGPLALLPCSHQGLQMWLSRIPFFH